MRTRRSFLSSAAVTAMPLAGAAAPSASLAQPTLEVPLDGTWDFRIAPAGPWQQVTVPHTWQTTPATVDYIGRAQYRRSFFAPPEWAGRTVRVEFEAVYHTAEVSLNGTRVGEHRGKGYTAFTCDLSASLKLGGVNTLEVSCDNSFVDTMLPRGKSYDWTPDGGIYRPVRLLVTPKVYLERIEIDAQPEEVTVRAIVRGGSTPVTCVLTEESTGAIVGRAELPRGEGTLVIQDPKLWHFDHPHLYRATVTAGGHQISDTFGIRRIEIRDRALYLNGERIAPYGVERMAGSHPQYGMAEPAAWIEHDHNDLKELNCIFTRVHWPQDRRVLDYCDRHGILMQCEVPTWGGDTFKGMQGEPAPALLQNGIEQLREMIARDRNHPSIFCWGLCNEVNGQNPAAKVFVRKMKEEARRLDPARLLTYASHSLRQRPENDVAGELDFISLNEYYESWYPGSPETLRQNLEAISRAFPDKMIVISEYGYCECTPARTGGDAERARILQTHNQVFRDFSAVGGLIFFCYNDYRTHMGDKGLGALKQRVHGVVDVYGARKPSFEILRRESSPIAAVEIEGTTATVRTTSRIPAYTLRGYTLRWTGYNAQGIPLEQGEAPLPDLRPGASAKVEMRLKGNYARTRVEVLRPTGFSAYAAG